MATEFITEETLARLEKLYFELMALVEPEPVKPLEAGAYTFGEIKSHYEAVNAYNEALSAYTAKSKALGSMCFEILKLFDACYPCKWVSHDVVIPVGDAHLHVTELGWDISHGVEIKS